jgi:rubrerythrin
MAREGPGRRRPNKTDQATARRRKGTEPAEGPRRQPGEPYVFECRRCGKVFESKTRAPLCPECDSVDVELLA